MNTIVDFFRQVNKASRYFGLTLANKGKFEEKIIRQIRIDYLRLKLVSLFAPGFVKKNIGKFRFLGLYVKFFDFDTFVSLIEEVFIENEYRPDSYKRRDKLFIIDLGSNIGISVLFFKTIFPNSTILSFEPDPVTFACLKDNVERAHLTNVELVNAAVFDKKGEVPFYIDKDGPGSPLMSIMQKRLPKQRIQVKAFPLSQFIKGRVDIVKMDIEGAETKVFEELDKSGKLKMIKLAFIEYHQHINKSEDSMSKILAILEKNHFGYQISAGQKPPFKRGEYEDIFIYAYRKK